MISKDKALKLIKIYMYVCKQYDENLKYYCQRYSNNSIPAFSDHEILTIYLFVGSEQRYTRLKEIHKFAKEYLLEWFPGLKLHIVGYRRKGHLPFPCQIVLSSASENDLTVFKRECVPAIADKTIFADKIYRDNGFWNEQKASKNNVLLTPVKALKGATEEERKRNKAADDLYSAAVSSVREPVEALYSWLIDKTNIQRAQKCRSTAGLIIHTLGKLAIAFIFLIFNY